MIKSPLPDTVTFHDIRNNTEPEKLILAGKYFNRKDYKNCEKILSWVFQIDPFNHEAIKIYGNLLLQQKRYGFAEAIFRYGAALHGKSADMFIGLGSSIRTPWRAKEALEHLNEALELDSGNTVALTNIGATYADINEYEKAIEYCYKASDIDSIPEDLAGFHKDTFTANDSKTNTLALSHLALEKYDIGFELNQHSLGKQVRYEKQYGNETRWNGEKDKAVIIYGEQGIGDEIFYGSCIPDAIRDCKEVIIDCDHRLEGLFKRSFPEAHVYGTRITPVHWTQKHTWDHRVALADLSVFYRKNREDFPGKSFLKADPIRSEQWALTLTDLMEEKGKYKNIGIAFRGGGSPVTRKLRSIPLEAFRPLDGAGNLISLEYDEYDYGDFPVTTYEWAAASIDYDNVAALVSQLDMVVTTCSAMVHLAGALGVPCYVLRNKYYSWRYANDMPWYNSVEIIKCDGEWEKGIETVLERVSGNVVKLNMEI